MSLPTPKESQVEAALVRHCRKHGIWTRKFVSPASAGVPDRVLGKGGKVLFLELKRGGDGAKRGSLTPLQEYEQGLMLKAGLSVQTAWGLEEARTLVDDFFADELL